MSYQFIHIQKFSHNLLTLISFQANKSFMFETEIKVFLMKPDRFLTFWRDMSQPVLAD